MPLNVLEQLDITSSEADYSIKLADTVGVINHLLDTFTIFWTDEFI